jgi:hypothetical protein
MKQIGRFPDLRLIAQLRLPISPRLTVALNEAALRAHSGGTVPDLHRLPF